MTREEFAYELEIQPRFTSSGEFDCNDTNALELAEKLFCIIDSLEQRNTELESRVKELKDVTIEYLSHPSTDGSNKRHVVRNKLRTLVKQS